MINFMNDVNPQIPATQGLNIRGVEPTPAECGDYFISDFLQLRDPERLFYIFKSSKLFEHSVVSPLCEEESFLFHKLLRSKNLKTFVLCFFLIK